MNTTIQLILEQDGDFILVIHRETCRVQHLRLHQLIGSSMTIRSRMKVGILGEPHRGLNSLFFLFRDVISLAGNFLIPWQSTGSADRYTCRTPHFHMHRHHTTRVAQDIWIVCHKKVRHPLAKSHQLLHITPDTCTSSPTSPVPDQHSFSHCDDLRPPLQGGTSTEQPPPTVVWWNLMNPRDNEQNLRSPKSMKITLKVKELLRCLITIWCASSSR